MAPPVPPHIPRFARAVLPILMGLAGAWLGMAVWGRDTVAMGPFSVELAAGFGAGATEISLPPFGRITADTHGVPLSVTATLRDVSVRELTGAFRTASTEEIVNQVERDAAARVTPFALRLFAVAVAGALAISLLAFRSDGVRVAAGTLAAVLAVGGGEILTIATYRPEAFLSPRFSGSLSAAPKLIGPVERATERIDDFRAELSRIVDGAVRAYTSIQGSPIGTDGEIRVLHISDVHLSPIGMEFAQQVARAFDVDLVVDTGDLTSFGTPPEELILSLIPGFGRPYVFVRGNHDSPALQAAIQEIPNAVVLDGQAREVAGLTLYGLGHPAFTPDRQSALDDEEVERLAREAGERLAADLSASGEPPDVVAVHDDRMAEAAAGVAPLVISGHFHRASARTVDGTVFLRLDSTGGSGATVFNQAGGVPLGLEILYFEPGLAPRLVAYDRIQQLPEAGDFSLQRHLVAEEFGELRPPEPGSVPAGASGTTP